MSDFVETDIEIGEDGSVKDTTGNNGNSKLDLICEAIEDPNYDPAVISKWIALEIANVAREMTSQRRDPSETWRLKGYTELIKALRELGNQLKDADTLNKKDVLNFDGAKFRYVVDTWCAMLVETMEEVGIFEDMQVSVMKQFRDKMSQNETQIRRETQKIDSAKAGK